MSRWYRFYDDAINDPKILRLSDAMFRAWVTLLCLASKHDGMLPTTADIALVLRVKAAKVAEWLAVLTAAGLMDNNDGRFSPHNWNARQFKSDVSNERVKRHRERRGNVTSVVTVTAPETEQIQSTEAEKKETREVALVDDGWPADYREQFWQGFPNKVGKPKALAKLDGCRKRGIAFADIVDGLERYIRTKPPDRPWLNPETFLNQERWTDQPAPTQQGNSNGRRTVQDAANDLIERLSDLDAPAPGGLCGAEGQGVIRLLPSR